MQNTLIMSLKFKTVAKNSSARTSQYIKCDNKIEMLIIFAIFEIEPVKSDLE